MFATSLRAKLLAAFAGLAAFVLAVAGFGAWAQAREHAHFQLRVNGSAARVALANEILVATQARAIAARNVVLSSVDGDVVRYHKQAAGAHEAVTAAHERLARLRLERSEVSAQERTLIDQLHALEGRYSPVALHILELGASGRKGEAIDALTQQCQPLLAALSGAAHQYIQFAQSQAAQERVEAEAKALRDQWLLATFCLATFVTATVLSWVLAHSLTGPIHQAVRIAQSVAAGDLTQTIHSDRRDEAGELLRALGGMNAALTAIVQRVRDGSDSIAVGSAQIASGNADLSRRTEDQAASLQQTASAMMQIHSTVGDSTQTATLAKDLVSEASESAQRGGQIVGQVVHTMNDIASSSQRIADIIGTIDGIAFQTNILALNAAVEAARAGEQGRGFAVVAGEVRQLAHRSAEAAREVRSLIGASVERVSAGHELVAQAGLAMGDIVTQITRVTQLITEISAAAGAQSDGIGQVNQAVSRLDQNTQQNAALVEQSAAAASSLQQQADGLAHVVGEFKLPGAPRFALSPI
jgi:methyl-accepting chemotaxis protein